MSRAGFNFLSCQSHLQKKLQAFVPPLSCQLLSRWPKCFALITTTEAGVGWDWLGIDGTLALTATPDNPWILEIHDYAGLPGAAGASWVIATANQIVNFDPAAVVFDIHQVDPSYPPLEPDDYYLQVRQGQLVFTQVPEPTSLLLAALMLAVAATLKPK